ncbi:MAG: NYN domain-containing protein [Polaromonas sp.]|nr:NYN domain-containing protein [Polaromonas sp.]
MKPEQAGSYRIALLIDADNAPAGKIEAILAELSKHGSINVRRAYGNWKKSELKGWEEALHEHAIRPMQQFDYTKGKNASDMAMVIDAMELLYTDRPHAFGIVSSDADFTPLVMHLKSKGADVFGFGQKKAPEPFQRACSTFLFVENLGNEPEQLANAEPSLAVALEAETLQPVPTAKLKMDTRLVKLLRGAVQSAADEDGWAILGSVGTHISNQASFDPRNYGYEKLGALFEATQLFETRRINTVMFVRDVRFGKARAVQKPANASEN